MKNYLIGAHVVIDAPYFMNRAPSKDGIVLGIVSAPYCRNKWDGVSNFSRDVALVLTDNEDLHEVPFEHIKVISFENPENIKKLTRDKS